ncbi:MAG: hypothetical protein ACOH17_13155 [Cellulomonas sp.]
MRTFERSVAFWLRAYPRRWRQVRSAEVTAVLGDLAGPAPHRLDARAALGLVRGGWATRWREHPPMGAYLRYRLNDRRLPVRHREWVRADIDGQLFPLRSALWRGGLILVGVLVARQLMGMFGPHVASGDYLASISSMIWMPVGVVAAGLLLGRAMRGRAARKHLVLRAGDPVAVGDLVEGLGPRRRLDARGGLTAALVVVSVAAVAWTTAALLAPKVVGATHCGPQTDDGSPWCSELVAQPVGAQRGVLALALVAAALLGLASVVVVRRRLERVAPTVVPQPNRELRGASASTVVSVTVVSAFILAEAWLEATGRLVILASGVLGVVALLSLPGVVVAWRFVRTSPDARGLAGSDVLPIVVRGRAPLVDLLSPGVVPVIGPVPPGTVYPAR